MIDVLNQKTVVLTQPAAIIDDAAVTVAALDAAGVGFVTFEVLLGATDIALTVCKLTESDDDSSYSDVPGADFSVLPATLPSATDDNKVFAVQVNMLGRKRYLKMAVTVGNGSAGGFVAVLARLSRMQITPSTATDRGYGKELFAG